MTVDPVGDWLFPKAVRAPAPEGKSVVVGFAAGVISTIALNRLLLRNAGVIGAAFRALLDADEPTMARQAATLQGTVDTGHEAKP